MLGSVVEISAGSGGASTVGLLVSLKIGDVDGEAEGLVVGGAESLRDTVGAADGSTEPVFSTAVGLCDAAICPTVGALVDSPFGALVGASVGTAARTAV